MTTFPHPRSAVAPLVQSPLDMDGDLDGAGWALANWSDSFVDIEGPDKPRPWHETRVKMLWDDTYLYIAARLAEDHLWATLTEHDSVIFQDNDFEVFVDPDGDNHNYFEYEINALGTDWDLRLPKPYRDGGSALNEWEAHGLKKSVRLNGTLNDSSDTDSLWEVALAFPWAVFSEHGQAACPPKRGDVWRINFSRVQWDLDVKHGAYKKVPDRPEHNWVWSPQFAVDMHRPELWGYVLFADHGAQSYIDPFWNDKCALMHVYWCQRDWLAKNRTYAASGTELGLELPDVSVERTSTGFVARLGEWSVREDSLLKRKAL